MKMLLIGSNIVVSTLSLLDSDFVVRLIGNCCSKLVEPRFIEQGINISKLVEPKLIEQGINISKLVEPRFIEQGINISKLVEPRFIEQGINISKLVEPRLIEQRINNDISGELITRTDKIIRDQSQFRDINKLTQQLPTFERLSSVNSLVKKFIESFDDKKISKILEQQEFFTAKKYSINPTLENSPIYSSILRSRLDDILRLSTLSERSLSRLSWEHIGNAIDLKTTDRSTIRQTLKRLTNSYTKLFESFESNQSSLISLSPTLLKYPSVEFFNEINIIESITTDADLDIYFEHEEEINQFKEDIKKETENTIEQLLGELNPKFINLLSGARHVLSDLSNPDRIRHFASSLRDLFTHVLHQIAPDNKIKTWSTSSQDYSSDGRPTRRARLLYICRELNNKPYSDFLNKDIDAVLKLLDLFQRGVHEVTAELTDLQLRMMLIRMEGVLTTLLLVWKETGKL
jgi:hypothetical protein